jgi:fused signal recognition particle receptor
MAWGAFDKLRKGLKKTRQGIVGKLGDMFGSRIRLDTETLDSIEEMLIGADLGVQASLRITKNIEKRLKEEGGESSMESVVEVIRKDITATLRNAKPRVKVRTWDEAGDQPAKKKKKGKKSQPIDPATDTVGAPAGPEVIFIVGVNGTGKTTSIAKLAYHYKQEGRKVLLAAGDTFRAAAVEQLKIWAERVDVECIQQGQNADPAAVVYDAIDAAMSRGHDLVIVDTAGRLHTKSNLMDELGKVARVIQNKLGRDPETLLVVDANTGQNGLQQAKVFAETVPVDGLILTKLDGTAKGGIVVSIAEQLGLPVRWIGVGEQKEDFAPFDPEDFAKALFASGEDLDKAPESN